MFETLIQGQPVLASNIASYAACYLHGAKVLHMTLLNEYVQGRAMPRDNVR